MTLVATVLALALPAPHDVCHTHACHERVQAKVREHVDYRLRHRCFRGSVVACVDRGAHLHRVNRWMMRRLAFCESRLNPSARNPSSATGLFQILYPSTWSTTPYRNQSPWSAKWNALAAAWMIAHGRRGEWVC